MLTMLNRVVPLLLTARTAPDIDDEPAPPLLSGFISPGVVPLPAVPAAGNLFTNFQQSSVVSTPVSMPLYGVCPTPGNATSCTSALLPVEPAAPHPVYTVDS